MRTSNFDKWLMTNADDLDSENEYINNRAYELLKRDDDYNPSDLCRMGEALSQASDDEHTQDIIDDYIAKKDWAKLGLKLYQISYEYQEEFAKNQAISEMQQGLHL
jgi:hypothetical protein